MADDSPAGRGGGNPSTTWRKISLPLPHLFPHLTINFRGHHPRPPSPTQQATTASAAKPAKRDWKLRRQKTYDSPGSLHQAISAAASPPAATTPVVDQNKVYRSSISTCLCVRKLKNWVPARIDWEKIGFALCVHVAEWHTRTNFGRQWWYIS